MNVQQLIDKLQKVENKSIPVCIARTGHAMGSSGTGMYKTGIELYAIKEANFVEGDSLGGRDEIETIDHIELLEEEE